LYVLLLLVILLSVLLLLVIVLSVLLLLVIVLFVLLRRTAVDYNCCIFNHFFISNKKYFVQWFIKFIHKIRI
jgi:hypothetical protein